MNLRRTKLSSRFYSAYTVLCAVFCSGLDKCVMCAREETPLAHISNMWFICPVVFAGGLRAGAHLIVGQNMAHNN